MTRIALQVNGQTVAAEVEPRTHLADFLREHLLLTGTHLGCEHGVCGACTLLLDGEPARSCITYAATCAGADIRTIEGLAGDPVTTRLRAAFTAEHALQCGYCTPGMLVTASDIVRRLPDASDDQIRLELAGNLCRCTGYNGIVRAIRRVLDEAMDLPPTPRTALPQAAFGPAEAAAAAAPVPGPSADGLHPRLRFDVPAGQLWQALRDPALIASGVPGARLTSVEDGTIAGAMVVALGPVRARFAGTATLSYDDAARTGLVQGGGQDQGSGTRLTASAAFRVTEDAAGCVLAVDVDYTLRGALAQLARGRVVDLVAGEIAALFARGLAARLRGEDAPAPQSLPGALLAVRVAWAWLRTRLRRG